MRQGREALSNLSISSSRLLSLSFLFLFLELDFRSDLRRQRNFRATPQAALAREGGGGLSWVSRAELQIAKEKIKSTKPASGVREFSKRKSSTEAARRESIAVLSKLRLAIRALARIETGQSVVRWSIDSSEP